MTCEMAKRWISKIYEQQVNKIKIIRKSNRRQSTHINEQLEI